MDTKTQQITIIVIGIIAMTATLNGNNTIIDVAVAGLIGFLGQKTLTEKQSEELNNMACGVDE